LSSTMVDTELNQWAPLVGGRRRSVTLRRIESGKLLVRVDERVVLPPAAEDVRELVFQIDRAIARLVRDESGAFSLVMRPDAHVARPEPVLPRTFFLARVWTWAFVAALAVAPPVWWVAHTTYNRVATRRVEAVLGGLATTPDQATVGLWFRDSRIFTDRDELAAASSAFDQWLLEKGLYSHRITHWSVGRVSRRDADVRTVVIPVEIDGRHLAVIVPDGRPLAWAVDPRPDAR
jgi:hypothetical protein